METTSKFEPLELEQIRTNVGKLMAETAKLNAETSKLNAEAGKLRRERNLYPVVILAGVLGAAGAVVGSALSIWLRLH